jgi:ribosomal protein S27E
MLNCPYCRKPAISLLRKCVLSPDQSVACSSCGKALSVPWGAVAVAAPVALGIIGAINFEIPWNALAAFAGVIAYGILQRWVVPLEGRDRA